MTNEHNIIEKEINTEKFLAKKPTHLATVFGVKFYEHPILGDEAPVMAITKDGRCGYTDFYEVPDHCVHDGFY